MTILDFFSEEYNNDKESNIIEDFFLTDDAIKSKKNEEEENKDDDTELLKYVYGDDKDASDISQYFKGMDITKDVQKEIDAKTSCKAIVKDESLPLSTSCDPQFQSLNTD